MSGYIFKCNCGRSHLIDVVRDVKKKAFSKTEKKTAIAHLLKMKKPQREIAQIMGMSDSYLSTFIKRNQLKKPRKTFEQKEFTKPAQQQPLLCRCCGENFVAPKHRLFCAQCAEKDAQIEPEEKNKI